MRYRPLARARTIRPLRTTVERPVLVKHRKGILPYPTILVSSPIEQEDVRIASVVRHVYSAALLVAVETAPVEEEGGVVGESVGAVENFAFRVIGQQGWYRSLCLFGSGGVGIA